MKKRLLALLCIAVCIFLFAACQTESPDVETPHEHSWATNWSNDATHHWHTCTGSDCTEVNDKAAHTGGNATCTEKATCSVCGIAYGELANHVYDKEVVDAKYLKEDATCVDKAIYYKSCACGATGTETFEHGETSTHRPASQWQSDDTKHWHNCAGTTCTEVLDEAEHSYAETVDDAFLKSPATCTAKAVYYKSCVCGKTSDETFESGETLAHTFDKEVASDANLASPATCTAKATYYKTCECGAIGTETFESGEMLAHTFDKEVASADFVKTAGNCVTPAVYNKSCECGAKGEATFTGAVDSSVHAGTASKYESTSGAKHIVKYNCCYAISVTENCTSDNVLHFNDAHTEEFNLCTLCNAEINKAAHSHAYTFAAGEGADAGYDVGTCACTETVKVKTDYTASTPVDVINGASAVLTMPEGFEGTVTGGNFGEALSFTGTTVDTTSIQIASHGLWASIDVTFTSEYGATHTAKVPVILITEVIDSVEELTAFAAKSMEANAASATLQGYYILGADIDCGGESIAAGGGGWNGGFYGTFDGRGHKISDLLTNNQGGLFGRIVGTVKNVHFENIAFGANSALFGKITELSTFENITVDIASWVSVAGNMTYAGVLGVSSNSNNTYNNFVINVGTGVSVSCLLGRQFTNSTGDITVNLGAVAEIVNYYTTDSAGANCVTTLPADSIIKVVEPEMTELSTLVAGENTTAVVFSNAAFAGNVTVMINGVTNTLSANAGSLSVDLADFGVSEMGKYTALIVTSSGAYAYSDVWYVTQVIDTVAELKALGAACKAANTTGYYILGANIDCSAEANMAAGNPGWEANGFSGTFDGRGLTISNIKMIYDDVTGGYGGLFGNLDGCTIRNIVFDKVNYASVNVSLLGRHTYKNKGPDNTNLENLTVNISNWAATGEAGVFVSRSSRNTLFNNCTVNVADGVTVHNLLGQQFSSLYGSGINVNLGTGSAVTAYYWTATDVSTAVTTAPSLIKVK